MNTTTPSYIVLVLLCLLMAIGCGTISHGTRQDITIRSTPADAEVWVDDQLVGTTPDTVNLARRDDHVVKIIKEGFKEIEFKIKSKTSGALFGNLLFGGLIGCIVDWSSGGAYTLSPDEITVHLSELSLLDGGVFYISPDVLEKIQRIRLMGGDGQTELLVYLNWQ